MITHIYFDWAGTLVKSNTIRRRTRKRGDCKLIYTDTKRMIEYLYQSGYTLGMITNSDKDVSYLIRCMTKYGLIQYFKGAIVVASIKGMKKKPHPVLFNTALAIDGISPENALMVGNAYAKDIVGAHRVGMKTAFMDRERRGHVGVEDFYIQDIIELGLYL
jgi:putative hydrolase of the HAD superfamily